MTEDLEVKMKKAIHVEPNTMKRRMILLWKLLYDQTDENHPVSTYDIVDYMAEHGIKISRKTIKPDIDLMSKLMIAAESM